MAGFGLFLQKKLPIFRISFNMLALFYLHYWVYHLKIFSLHLVSSKTKKKTTTTRYSYTAQQQELQQREFIEYMVG